MDGEALLPVLPCALRPGACIAMLTLTLTLTLIRQLLTPRP